MGVDVVRDTLDTIFKAFEDLLSIHDRDISLQFGFCNIRMVNRKLTVVFADYLKKDVTDSGFEKTMRRMNSPVSTLWKTNTDEVFKSSQMGSIIKKPNLAVTEALAQKTQALKLMSMDMSSSAGFKTSAAWKNN